MTLPGEVTQLMSSLFVVVLAVFATPPGPDAARRWVTQQARFMIFIWEELVTQCVHSQGL